MVVEAVPTQLLPVIAVKDPAQEQLHERRYPGGEACNKQLVRLEGHSENPTAG